MAKVFVTDTHLNNIGTAIRSKNGSTTKYKPSEMASAINNLSMSEDLSSELTTQNTLLTNQTSKLSSVVTALQGKAAGGSGKVLTGGDIYFTREEGTTYLGSNLKMGIEFDETKQYKLNLTQNVLFNGALPDDVPKISFDLNFSYIEQDGLETYSCTPTVGSINGMEVTINQAFMYLGNAAAYQYATALTITIVPSYSCAMINIDTSDTTTCANFMLGVWLEEA